MKKSIMFVMATIVVAGTLFTKANKETKMSDTVLANIEALAQSEKMEDGYYCYGTGNVRCPYSGELVGGYLKHYNLE